MALLVHGLGGSHRSAYVDRMTQRLSELGWRVFRMDLRGAGASVRFARRLYNAACSDDVRAVVHYLTKAFPGSPLALIGFSLGGNIVLKFAGELGDESVPGLRAVAALAPPIDLARCSEMMAHQPLYDAFYVYYLVKQVKQHHRCFPDLPRVVFPRDVTLRRFDELYTAPRGGYVDVLDYYHKASAVTRIGAIRLPTFILTARDDPFVAVEPFEQLQAPAGVEVHIASHGGHLGFLGRDDTGGIRWADTETIRWLEKHI
jgi:predicted alpha/beta-fold hydrolase